MDAITTQNSKASMKPFNATDDATILDRCLHHLIEHSVDRYMDKVAVICGANEITYGELNVVANRLAHILVKRGIGRGDLVAVALNRSIELVVALLGIMKVGAAYVPIDISFPLERVRQMMNDADPKIVVTLGTTPESLLSMEKLCLRIDDIRKEHFSTNTRNLCVDVSADDLVYVIYTSGSTGRPKGVEISHGAVSNLLFSMRRSPGCEETDRLLAITTVSFDIAVLELFLPLVCGATTVIAQTHEVRDASALLMLMNLHTITMMQGTPATWQLLLDSGWRGAPHLMKILCGGETLPRRLAADLLVCGDAVWNMYGPTEATVWASAWKVCEDHEVVIGDPIANTRLYVLDVDLSPVQLGSSGELYIGGVGLARGYHKNSELTRARFVNNPFHPGTLYRTGDLARFLAADKLCVLGRNDDQVKVRGHRIELGDIEATITDHVGIAKAVVVSRNDRLVAYCIRQRDQETDENKTRVVEEWAGAWDHAYGVVNEDGIFNLAGWYNSYNGLPFSAGEMRDWQLSSVRRILSYNPKQVFEIGSGTGLMLFSIAPHCSRYHATDASVQAVEFTRDHLGSLAHVICEKYQAHALPVLEKSFDTVVVNSVVQYFPSIYYLISVLDWATKAVDTGRIYVGDVRNLTLLDMFHYDVTHFRTDGHPPPEELASRAEEGAKSESELVISPDFFANLPSIFPRITRVDITLRDGCYENEMTRYRYDATLHIQENDIVQLCTNELDWQKEKLDISSLRDKLNVTSDVAQRLNNIPNGRLQDVYGRVGVPLGDASYTGSTWVDPGLLKDFAVESGLELVLVPSRSRRPWSFDAVLWLAGGIPDLSFHPPDVMGETFAKYANVPKVGETAKPALGRLLRPWLAERLPTYMVPSFFVELDKFPLTLNGKIDRKALPSPEASIEATGKPTTEMERDIQAVWSDVLGHDRIDVSDNFFQIGGDSLRVVRVQMELEKLLGRSILSAKLFEYYTIKALAAYLTRTNDNIPESIPMLHPDRDNEGIAIVSMACRLPGGITTPEEYWELLESGRDAITGVPKDRWNAEAIYDPDPGAKGKSYCRRGGFISSIDSVDAAFFGISSREARLLEPTQYVMLESCWEAFESAGYTLERLHGSQTGVFIGVSNIPAYHSNAYGPRELDGLDGYAGTGSAGGTLSGRVSYTLGLQGPALTVDTACSSSLVTTHLACTALRRGECDLAVSGGVSLMLSPGMHVEFSRLHGLAPDGQCRPFADDTQGTSWSEGCATIVLKRLSDAQRDHDRILAVLRGTAVNHGGRSASLTTPSGPSQKRLIRTAIAQSGLHPSDIDYVEAHGTGTKLGDPIEGAALAEVFHSRGRSHAERLWIGSAKSNIGHTQAAAGLAGLLKVVLSMNKSVLPRTLHIGKPTPAVDWNSANMALVQEHQPWLPLKGRLRRAGVSAFGIGGTNAHVIVEEPPRQTFRSNNSPSPLPRMIPFVLSGNTDEALRQQAKKLQMHLSSRSDSMHDVAYSLATTRNHFRKRIVLMVQSKEELLDKLKAVGTGAILRSSLGTVKPRLAMLFTGQGSLLLGIGKDLARHYPVFRETLEEVAAHFAELELPLLDAMWADAETDSAALIQQTDYAQPALFAFGVALWRLWSSWGVQPEFLFGHSVGELAAAHVAGVMDLVDACRLVAARGRLMQALSSDGKMIALEANASEVSLAIELLRLDNKIDIAGQNTPTQTVASGDVDAIKRLGAHFAGQGRKFKTLEVSRAFHSHHMDEMLADFHAVAMTVHFRAPSLPIVSGLTGQLAIAGQLEQPEYWVCQVRNAVLFNDSIQTLAGRGMNISLELGPQPVLSSMGAACLASTDILSNSIHSVAWLPSAVGQDGVSVIQNSLAELHMRDVAIDWLAYFKPFSCQRVKLPTYAFQRMKLEGPPVAQPNHAETVQHSMQKPYRCRDMRNALILAAPEQHTEIVLAMIRETAALVLGLTSPEAIDMGLRMQDIGVDSFTAILMRNELAARTGLTLSAMVVIDHPNLEMLSKFILHKLHEDLINKSSSISDSGSATTSSPPGSSVDLKADVSCSSSVQQQSSHHKSHPGFPSIAPVHRVLSPSLGLNPPNTPPHLFQSAMDYFSNLPWCFHLIYDLSPDSGLLPGYGQAIPFISQCFNPASELHDQYIGNLLSRNRAAMNVTDNASTDRNSKMPPLRHMLSLFRLSDASHLDESSRHIPRVSTLFALGGGTSGHVGILHGGLTASLLDESMSIVHELNAALGMRNSIFSASGVTASLNIRFLAPIAVTETALCVTAWVENIQGCSITMKAEITNSKGNSLAEAEAVFISQAICIGTRQQISDSHKIS
jgi:amino acid adenylation domain-containing protein